ncbi:MAG TPA: c-type cytochrome [Vicinamibacterales bacterium]|nr:c-type cytochrome [Vicinamibacterales bacterium]
MARSGSVWVAGAAIVFAGAVAVSARAPLPQHAKPTSDSGWTIPPDARTEQNPMAGNPAALATGKQLFKNNCQRCHGPGGKGDGPDADPDRQHDMDLTNPAGAAANPDGVVFYKAWNGRQKPKMPAFRDKLTKDQLWQIVTYVETLRQKS